MAPPSFRQIAGGLTFVYLLLITAMNLEALRAISAGVFVLSGLAAAAAVVFAGRADRQGTHLADVAAQLGLGFLVGLLAQPASSGVVAVVALVAGLRAIIITRSNRLFAGAAFPVGIAAGAAVLWVPLGRI